MHYRVAASKLWEKVSDICLVVIGIIAMGYTTALTIINWSNSDGGKPAGYCDDIRKSW